MGALRGIVVGLICSLEPLIHRISHSTIQPPSPLLPPLCSPPPSTPPTPPSAQPASLQRASRVEFWRSSLGRGAKGLAKDSSGLKGRIVELFVSLHDLKVRGGRREGEEGEDV